MNNLKQILAYSFLDIIAYKVKEEQVNDKHNFININDLVTKHNIAKIKSALNINTLYIDNTFIYILAIDYKKSDVILEKIGKLLNKQINELTIKIDPLKHKIILIIDGQHYELDIIFGSFSLKFINFMYKNINKDKRLQLLIEIILLLYAGILFTAVDIRLLLSDQHKQSIKQSVTQEGAVINAIIYKLYLLLNKIATKLFGKQFISSDRLDNQAAKIKNNLIKFMESRKYSIVYNPRIIESKKKILLYLVDDTLKSDISNIVQTKMAEYITNFKADLQKGKEIIDRVFNERINNKYTNRLYLSMLEQELVNNGFKDELPTELAKEILDREITALSKQNLGYDISGVSLAKKYANELKKYQHKSFDTYRVIRFIKTFYIDKNLIDKIFDFSYITNPNKDNTIKNQQAKDQNRTNNINNIKDNDITVNKQETPKQTNKNKNISKQTKLSEKDFEEFVKSNLNPNSDISKQAKYISSITNYTFRNLMAYTDILTQEIVKEIQNKYDSLINDKTIIDNISNYSNNNFIVINALENIYQLIKQKCSDLPQEFYDSFNNVINKFKSILGRIEQLQNSKALFNYLADNTKDYIKTNMQQNLTEYITILQNNINNFTCEEIGNFRVAKNKVANKNQKQQTNKNKQNAILNDIQDVFNNILKHINILKQNKASFNKIKINQQNPSPYIKDYYIIEEINELKYIIKNCNNYQVLNKIINDNIDKLRQELEDINNNIKEFNDIVETIYSASNSNTNIATLYDTLLNIDLELDKLNNLLNDYRNHFCNNAKNENMKIYKLLRLVQ